MSLTTWLWGTSQLDDAVDKATSEFLPSGAEDIALNLEICDQIRSKSVSAKEAMRALKRRLNHKNPNVQLLALSLADICIKNGGDHFLTEVASREFMDNLVSILKMPMLNGDVKNKILRMIQNWGIAFEGKATLSYVGQVYKTLKTEGFQFPPQDLAVANSAMVDTQTAPEWIDSDVCLRCRTAFSFTNRKHHCRNCGQVFDQQCSSKTMPLPHFGITQEVRVCDGCYAKLLKKGDKGDQHKSHRHSASLHGARHRSARELADAELQRAIQLSLEEVGAAHGHRRPGYVPSQPSPSSWQTSEPPLVDRSTHPDLKSSDMGEEDPDLKAAIEASLREANAPRPSAPVALETPRSENPPFAYGAAGYSQSYPPTATPTPAIPSAPKLPNYDLEPIESDAILTFSQTVEQVEAQGGRDLSKYPAVNELLDKANGLRPKLAMSLDDTGRKEQMLSEMHDKLSQAVKLYDNLLTAQVSHPTWTRSPPAQASPYQGASTGYSHTYQAQNGPYGQWSPPQLQQQAQAPPMSPGYQQYGEALQTPRQTHSPQVSYFNSASAQEHHTTPINPVVANSSFPAQISAPPAPESQPAWQRQSRYAEQGELPQFTQQPQHVPQLAYSQTAQQYSEHVPISAPPPPAPQFNAPQAPIISQSPSIPQVSAPTPTVQPHHSMSSNPPTLTQPSSSPLSSNLARHNTTSYAPKSQQSHGHYLSRHNTIAAGSPSQSQQQQPMSLPQFPVAPTSAPQSFPLYGPPIPNNLPQERKEALLIDL